MNQQQLERDPLPVPPVAAASCIDCGGPCLWSERRCFSCQLIDEDLAAETE
jgi:hypothetical protein